MPTISDWLRYNADRVRVSWEPADSGNMLVAAAIEVGYARTYFGFGPFAPATEPDAKFVCAYAYTPRIAGDTVGPRTYIAALGAPVALPDHTGALFTPDAAIASFVGTIAIPQNGLLIVYHFLNAQGQVLGRSISLNRVITSTASGNDIHDYAVVVGNTVLDAAVTTMQRAVGGLIDQIAETTGMDRTTVTIILIIAGVGLLVIIIRR